MYTLYARNGAGSVAVEALLAACGADYKVVVLDRKPDGSFEDFFLAINPKAEVPTLVLPDGKEAVKALAKDARTLEAVRDQYRHCKAILALGAGAKPLEQAGIATALPDGSPDEALVVAQSGKEEAAMGQFLDAMRKHRNFARESDPPLV